MGSGIYWGMWAVVVAVLFGWYAIPRRHESRSIWNAAVVFSGMTIVIFIAMNAVTEVVSLLLQPAAPYQSATDPHSTLGYLITLLVPTGLSLVAFYVLARTILEPTLTALIANSSSRKEARNLCVVATTIVFLILPLVTLVTLLVEFDSYGPNRLRGSGEGSVVSAFQIVLRSFSPVYAGAVSPFIVLYFILARSVAKWDLGRLSSFAVVLTSLLCFSLPYMLMLHVLAFDVMELDFPSATLLPYLSYFLVLAPVVGGIFTSICLALWWSVLRPTVPK